MLLDVENSSPVGAPGVKNQVVVTSKNNMLGDIGAPTTSLVIWERMIPSVANEWLKHLAPDQLPQGRVLANCKTIEKAVGSFFVNCAAKDGEAARCLEQDIIKLANIYSDIAKTDTVDIRLDAIQHDACWKFHLDQVALRMVTTYIGAGTQYVVAEHADEALRQQKAYSGPLKKIPEQAVAIFKGAHSRPGAGILHRSPPANSFSGTRLLLCINAQSHASPELWTG